MIKFHNISCMHWVECARWLAAVFIWWDIVTSINFLQIYSLISCLLHFWFVDTSRQVFSAVLKSMKYAWEYRIVFDVFVRGMSSGRVDIGQRCVNSIRPQNRTCIVWCINYECILHSGAANELQLEIHYRFSTDIVNQFNVLKMWFSSAVHCCVYELSDTATSTHDSYSHKTFLAGEQQHSFESANLYFMALKRRGREKRGKNSRQRTKRSGSLWRNLQSSLSLSQIASR